MDPLIILYSLFGPFLIWPVEYFLPYPYIIEELFKSVVVLIGPRKASVYAVAGVLFALTETVLYTINVNIVGSIGLMAVRFITSSLLHSFTFLVIYWFVKRSRKLVAVGFITAALIHFLYNSYIPTY
jgi:RsiW-degrading membrane proteinase PrsW (M82 family)